MQINELLKIMEMLRDPEHGCPWDRKQTYQTIAPHTLEEAYEVIDTIEREDYEHLANELGDLLFQVVFYAQLGKEEGRFDFNDIVSEIGNKLLQRHPHVFPEASAESFGTRSTVVQDQVEANWETIKQTERQQKGGEDTSVLDDIPKSFPALTRATKIQKRAAHAGFDWPDHTGVLDKIREEIQELEEALEEQSHVHIEEELGDLMFTLVNLSRHLKIDSETSLRKANEKFESRFRALEKKAAINGISLQSLGLDKLEEYWQEVKKTV
jgi:nucleoside triphosphate diphosphatase